MIKQEFDLNDPKNVGRPIYFNVDYYCEAIKQMIRADEIQIALQMCDNLPGWYRDNVPKQITEIKDTLYKQCYDPFDYASDADEAGFSREFIEEQCLSQYTWPRADILFDDVKKMNADSITPWIFEVSPSHGWLPLGFASRGLKFNFFGKNLNQKALDKIKQWLPEGYWQEVPSCSVVDKYLPPDTKPVKTTYTDQPTILVCFEALEHMWNPHDLEQSAKKIGVDFDFIYLSTPKYTLGGGLPDWDTRRLGHVRTWTPKEFVEFANKSFPGYTWAIVEAHSMVIKGIKCNL